MDSVNFNGLDAGSGNALEGLLISPVIHPARQFMNATIDPIDPTPALLIVLILFVWAAEMLYV